jgi:hypothetical protein
LRVQEPRVLDPLPLAADRSVEHGKMQTHGVPYLSLLSCRPPLFVSYPGSASESDWHTVAFVRSPLRLAEDSRE